MNIGIITTWFERGAAYVSRQFRQALEREHRVFIYARGETYAAGDPRWNDPAVTWGKPGIVPLATSIDLHDFRKWLEENRIEVAFFNEQYWWDPVLLCNQLGIKTCNYMASYTEETIPLYGCYDFLICNTRQHLQAFDWHPQAFYVPWGTDLDLYRMQVPGRVDDKCVTFFHSGGWNPFRKGTDLVVQAFEKVRGPAKLVLHIQAHFDDYFPHLSATLARLIEEKRIIFYEQTVAAPGLFHLGDVYVYPTRLDSLALTVAEALACGLPVITVDYAPLNEFVNATNGRLVKVARVYGRSDGHYWPQYLADEEDLVQQMQSYVDRMDAIPRMKQVARTYAEEHLNWNTHAQVLLESFRKGQRLEGRIKERASQLALSYEKERTRPQLRLWLSYEFPWLVGAARAFWRAGKRLIGSRKPSQRWDPGHRDTVFPRVMAEFRRKGSS